jgi:hypothetical protein
MITDIYKHAVQGYRVISILLISPPKVIYAELIYVKDTPHFFFQTYFRITLYVSVWHTYLSCASGSIQVRRGAEEYF